MLAFAGSPARHSRRNLLAQTPEVIAPARPAAAVPACLLAWLMPGAGHLYLRRPVKGLILLGAIQDARLQPYMGFDDPLAMLRSLAQMAMGLPYFLARLLGFGPADTSTVVSVTHEYGNTFTEVGGLLNILVIIDAYDTAMGRKP
jgi:hypothetical protein